MHYSSSDVFLSIFAKIRKDRVEGWGDVFIATHKKLLMTKKIDLESDSEVKSVKVSLEGSKPIFIGNFWRQPSSVIQLVPELDRSLTGLLQAR